MKRIALTLMALVMLLTPLAPASATTRRLTVETYGDYSMMFARVGGQHFSGTQVAGQWSRLPVSTTESWAYFGAPWTSTPPAYHERFLRTDVNGVQNAAGDWVSLDGWWDNGTYYTDRTISEWQANADCTTGKTFFTPGGPQHYARWDVGVNTYCLEATMKITEQSTNKSFTAVHRQIWSPPSMCPSNPYGNPDPSRTVTTCIKQREQWSSNQTTPTITMTLDRSVWFAKAYGTLWHVEQTVPFAWQSFEKYAWRY